MVRTCAGRLSVNLLHEHHNPTMLHTGFHLDANKVAVADSPKYASQVCVTQCLCSGPKLNGDPSKLERICRLMSLYLQEVVYKDLGESIVTNALAGFNCSLFAYGYEFISSTTQTTAFAFMFIIPN